MGTVHDRDPCDWTLETTRHLTWKSPASPSRYALTLRVTSAGAQRIAGALLPWRGNLSFTPLASAPFEWYVTGIEVTAQEAALIAGGAHPLDVVCKSEWPGGYLLRVVPEDLSGVM